MAQARQITDAEKQAVLERQGRRCFIDNHEIPPNEEIEFDHSAYPPQTFGGF
jgi:hypothetical protein